MVLNDSVKECLSPFRRDLNVHAALRAGFEGAVTEVRDFTLRTLM